MMNNRSGQTPLSDAVEIGNEAIVRLLHANGADFEKETDTVGHHFLPTGNRQKAVVQVLLENGAKACQGKKMYVGRGVVTDKQVIPARTVSSNVYVCFTHQILISLLLSSSIPV